MEIIWLKKIRYEGKNIEAIVFAGALMLGIVAAYFFYSAGMLAILVDENAHLNVARQVFDSLTPGFSQLGLWPMLFHIVLSPFVQIDFLWRSGLAGFLPSVLFFAFSCLFLFKAIDYAVGDKSLALMGTAIFAFNPYVLYFATVAMMEMLFIMNLIITAYYYIRWEKTNKLTDLMGFSIFISLSSISRFEGLALPLVFFFLIIFKRLGKIKTFGKKELEATLIVFLFLASFGLEILLLYSFVFAADPFAFASGEWSAFSQQHSGAFVLPAEGNLYNSFLYMAYSARHMVEVYTLVFSALALLIFIFWRKGGYLKILLIFSVPFLFNIFSLYWGNSIVYLPELPPYERFLNVRYGIFIVPFAAASAAFLLSLVRHPFVRRVSALLLLALSGNFFFLYVNPQNSVISKESAGYPPASAMETAEVFLDNYDGGKVLLTRGLNDYLIRNSKIDISDTINESNYLYWQQSLEEPWIFARWVVMLNGDSEYIWEASNDEISRKWSGDQWFLQFYEVKSSNNDYILLKIKEDSVLRWAEYNKIDEKKIPSINTHIENWDVSRIKEEIKK